jgi:integrase
MPRGRGRGAVIKRGKTFSIKFYIGGRARWERVGTSATQAKKLLTQRLNEVDLGLISFERAGLFKDFVKRWRADYLGSAQLKPSTLSAYKSILDHHLIPYFGEVQLDRINAGHVQRFVAEKIAESSARGRELRPKTIQNCVRVLSKIFNTALDWQMLSRSPMVRIRLPRVERREMDFLRPEEVRVLLTKTEDPDFRCLLMLAIFSGMRQGELLALQWGDVDWNRSTIKVRRAFSRGKLMSPKTATSIREVRVGRQLLVALREHQMRCGARSEFIFSARNGAHLDPANLMKRGFEPAVRHAGLRKIRFHDLRHTYASIMINEGANLKFVSKQLGHSSIQITLDRYSHLIPERHDAAIEHFEQVVLVGGDPEAARKAE